MGALGQEDRGASQHRPPPSARLVSPVSQPAGPHCLCLNSQAIPRVRATVAPLVWKMVQQRPVSCGEDPGGTCTFALGLLQEGRGRGSSAWCRGSFGV